MYLCRKKLSRIVEASEHAAGSHQLECLLGSTSSRRRFVRHFQSCYERRPDESKQGENR
jgi:hypothetical protein